MEGLSGEKMGPVVGQRVSFSLKSRLRRIYDRYGISEAVLLRDALDAVCSYVEENGGYRRPIQVCQAAESKGDMQELLEEPAPVTNPRKSGQPTSKGRP